jgi:hypothetical protein
VQSRWAISAFAQLSSNRQRRVTQQARSTHAQALAGPIEFVLLIGPEPHGSGRKLQTIALFWSGHCCRFALFHNPNARNYKIVAQIKSRKASKSPGHIPLLRGRAARK